MLLSAHLVELAAELSNLGLKIRNGFAKPSVFGEESLTTRTGRNGNGHGFHPGLEAVVGRIKEVDSKVHQHSTEPVKLWWRRNQKSR